jgi:hypothetical protein
VTPGAHPAKPAVPGDKPKATEEKTDKPVRVGQPAPAQKPKYQVPSSQRIAAVQAGQ